MSADGTTIGVPREIKDGERRVVLTPSGIHALVGAGHRVAVEQGAGRGAGYDDEEYHDAGAALAAGPDEVWDAEVVVKVKEPQPEEYRHLRAGLRLFAFLHLAADQGLTSALLESGVDAYAFETLVEGDALPLLAPMSEVAGRAAAIIAAELLSTSNGGSGVLVGGAAGVPPARVAVLGMGVVGTLAARGLRGLGGTVTGVDVDLARLLDRRIDGAVDATQVSEPREVAALVRGSDVVVGAVLVPGGRAPVVVAEEDVAAMRDGSVVVDLAVDQGGCLATTTPTSLTSPTYRRHGVVHYAVPNVPGQYPRTASAALSAAVMPRLGRLADTVAAGADPGTLSGAANVLHGELAHPALTAVYGGAAAHRS